MTCEFFTTATFRPDLLMRTYDSFSKHLKGISLKDTRLILNVDPLPLRGNGRFVEAEKREILYIAHQYFGDVIYRFAETPSFPRAVEWCFQQANQKYLFGLQDDWLLKTDIDLGEMAFVFESLPKEIVQLKLSPNLSNMITLAPALFRTSFCKSVVIDDNLGPERQLNVGDSFAIPWTFNSRDYRKQEDVIEDIGREWRSQMGIERRGDSLFTTWDKQKNIIQNSIISFYGNDTALKIIHEIVLDEVTYAEMCPNYWDYRLAPYTVLKKICSILSDMTGLLPLRILTIDHPVYNLLFNKYKDHMGVEFDHIEDEIVNKKYDLVVIDLEHSAMLKNIVHEKTSVFLLSNNMIPILRLKARTVGKIEVFCNPVLLNQWEMTLGFLP